VDTICKGGRQRTGVSNPPPPKHYAPRRRGIFKEGGLIIYKATRIIPSNYPIRYLLLLCAPQITLPEIYTRQLPRLLSQEPTELLVLLDEGQQKHTIEHQHRPIARDRRERGTKTNADQRGYTKMFLDPRYTPPAACAK
ncbi:unnamed protein product, partial [Ectocarpus sp. 8 AP-2014]